MGRRENKVEHIAAIFAHPDDEIVVMGVLHKLKLKGHKIHFMCATHGEAGHYRNKIEGDYRTLSEVRQAEYQAVCLAFGSDGITHFDWGDGQSQNWHQHHPIRAIQDYVIKHRISSVITFDKQGGNGHPDHQMISKLVSAAIDLPVLHVSLFKKSLIKKLLWFLPVKKKNKLVNKMGTDDKFVDFVVKLNSDELQKKIQLIKCHHSQFPDEKGRYYKLPPILLKRMMKYECYQLSKPKDKDYFERLIHE